MRLSRFAVLSKPSGIVHLFWRCHNREYLLDRPKVKKLFFDSLVFGLQHRGTDSSVKLHSFCLMGNHVHQQMSFGPSPEVRKKTPHNLRHNPIPAHLGTPWGGVKAV
jgi:REP element-mobilizing transposase RayT